MASFDITWEAPEFEYREKDVSWYWISIIVASLIVAFAVWERNFLFGFFLVVAEVLFVVWGNELPRTIAFRMTDKEIWVGSERSYPLSHFESFSIGLQLEGWAELILVYRTRLRLPLRIIILEEDLDGIKKNLAGTLKEVEYHPSFLDSLERLLRF